LLVSALPLFAQDSTTANWDKIAEEVLQKTGVPSASVAVVRDGKIAYLHAYGYANLENKTAAQPSMRYSVGSISKQFTASAILLLQEQGKLSVDDKVSKWVPGLTDGDKVTIRQLLSHTSGYQDYWPQDYVMPGMLQPTSAQQILNQWAKIPLDFVPGTKWQYSNTNYVIAGLIVEKAAGKPLLDFLQERVFGPLGMKSVANTDQAKLPPTDPTGYMRYALGPLHPAPKEGKGWMFAAGELAMTAEDLARWDISLMNQTVLKPESYQQMETEVLLKNGAGTRYGLGVDVGLQGAHRYLGHGGEVSGFVSSNTVFPDDKSAVVVLTNQDAIGAASQIADKIGQSFFAPSEGSSNNSTETAKQVFAGLQQGKIDRSLFTSNCNAYFDETALHDYASSLEPLGKVQDFTLTHESLRGGMVHRSYSVKLDSRSVSINSYWMPDGKIEQFIVTPRD
jgi:CubicO group peptidase (beta-lactamase class C family)